MTAESKSKMKLGVNGFGRIGKSTVWHHVARKYFAEIVVNIGRQAGTSLADMPTMLKEIRLTVGSTVSLRP